MKNSIRAATPHMKLVKGQEMGDFEDSKYRNWQKGITKQIRGSKSRALIAANSEMLILYWKIGQDIIERAAFPNSEPDMVNQLAADLQVEFPNFKGFTLANLLHMKSFAETWTDPTKVQQEIARLPWGHIVCVLDAVSEINARNWYVMAAIKHGWTLNMLKQQIEIRAHEN